MNVKKLIEIILGDDKASLKIINDDADYWDLATGFGTYQGPDPFIRPLNYLRRRGLEDDSEDSSSSFASSKDEQADPQQTALPPEDKKLLTEPSEGNGWDVPWGEPPEGYRKVGVGERAAAPRSFLKSTTASLIETLLK